MSCELQAAQRGISENDLIKKVELKKTVDWKFGTVLDVPEVALLFARFGSNALSGSRWCSVMAGSCK